MTKNKNNKLKIKVSFNLKIHLQFKYLCKSFIALSNLVLLSQLLYT